MSVAGKAVLVTGVTTGLGRGIAAVFAEQGARVVGTGRRRELGEQLEKEIRDRGGEMVFVPADVRRVSDCERAVAATVDGYGRIDVLINNAGTEGEVIDTHRLTEQMYDDVLDTNLKGAVFCTRYALEQMVAQRAGHVLNISSINAVNGPCRQAAYSASKAGMLRFTQTLADEYVTQGIRINAIILGNVAVGETAQRSLHGYAKYMLGPDAPAPDLGDNPFDQSPEDVARSIAVLCDDDAGLITGACIPIDRAMSNGFATSLVGYMLASGIWTIPSA